MVILIVYFALRLNSMLSESFFSIIFTRWRSKRSPGQPQLPGSEKQSSRNNLNFPDVDVSDEHDETDRPRKQQCHDHLRSKYPFIDWQVLLSLPQEDVTFLFAKGALTLPDEAAVDEFVYQYFKRIHPSLPMVDEAGVSRIYYNRLPGKLSLFVFQGMLFASCSVSIFLGLSI